MKTQTTLSMQDILLTLLYVNGSTPIASKKKMFKTLKYFQENMFKAFNEPFVVDGGMYDFIIAEHGLFSGSIVNDLEFFADLGYISVKKLETRNLSYGTYYLTGAGKKKVENEIIPHLTKTQVLILSQLKDMALSNFI